MVKSQKELNFKAEDKPIEDVLFSNYKYRIPRYQRPYAWGEDEMVDFWVPLLGVPFVLKIKI